MQGISNHIISKFRWDTSFDRKEKASELQERLSAWSRMNMQKEITDIFDKVCPPEQTWRIDLLELDLGVVDFNDLEFELALKLRRMLSELLVDLIIHSNKTGRSNIEILNEDASHISILRIFLLEGIMPWNYKPAGGSLNEMMMYQLQNNRPRLISMLRETGATHENVRKRIAWQISDVAIVKIIEGLEPNNHSQVIDFSTEMTRIQMKETVVQASTMDFKKNLWLWILNYLLTERGTIFSKVAFMRSSIRQMATYYNIAYDELFELIERAVDAISKISGIRSDFILTLKILSKENRSSDNDQGHSDDPQAYRERFRELFLDRSLRSSALLKAEFNELVIGLFKQDQQAFRGLILSFNNSRTVWSQAISDLNDASLEAIITALNPASAAMITEIIYFLHRLGRRLNPAVKRKMLWRTSIRFLQQQQNGSFSRSTFLSYCIAAISKKNGQSGSYLLDQLMNAEVGASAKGMAALDIYNELNTVLVQELAEQSPAFFEANFKELIAMSQTGLSADRADKELFDAVRHSLVRSMQLQPQRALAVLLAHPDKRALREILPHLLNDYSARLLMKYIRPEINDVVSVIRQAVTELKTMECSSALADTITEKIVVTAVETVVLHPSPGAFRFLELMLASFYEESGIAGASAFSVFTELLFRDERLSRVGVSKTAALALKKKYAVTVKHTVAERVQLLVAASGKKEPELAEMLKKQFSAKDYAEIKTLQKEQRETLQDCLVTNGKKTMETLLKEYTELLRKQTEHFSEKESTQQLTELYWKCILNYNDHRGNVETLRRSFRAAVLYTFPVKKKNMVAGDDTATAGNKIMYRLAAGIQLSSATVHRLIEEGFAGGAASVQYNGKKIRLKELIMAVLEKDPQALRRLIAAGITPQTVRQLKTVIPFNIFCNRILAGAGSASVETLRSIRLLHELVVLVAPAAQAGALLEECWELSLKFITQGQRPVTEALRKLVQQAVQQLAAGKNAAPALIISVMKDKNIQLTPTLKVLLDECLPGFFAMEMQLPPGAFAAGLQKAESKGLLDKLWADLLGGQQVPAWFENQEEQQAGPLLDEMIARDPQLFMDVIGREIITGPQMRWLHESADFKTLIRSIGAIHRNRQSQLNIFEELYRSMERIAVKGIAAKEIRYLLFRKLLKAGTSGNWRIISSGQILNELTWDLCVKRGVAKKDFFQGIEKIRIQMPLSIQVELEQLKDRERASLAATADKTLPGKKLLPQLKNNAVKTAKGGIPVRNAGMVLISNYVGMLLERLGLVTAGKFTAGTQADAPHYLQYVVTGLSATEESFLPLNKVLCGLPLSGPLKAGITISEEHKTLINGLVKAMIGYWPAIGNCSVDGFRGNWLVRDGLLMEHEERWELTVEKRAYDVLIHQSPFSFSIIKYPWMQKPLHVTWPY